MHDAEKSETDVSQPLPKEQVYAALRTAPFTYVPGTFNTRDLGLVSSALRPGLAYRSGMLTGLGEEGKKVLREKLGVKKIFDLRSVREREAQPDPAVERVENVDYGGSVKGVLEHVRDGVGEGFLFHCTAGRDRTGVVAGLLMTLAGAKPEDIKLDFMLSRIGTEPAREQLVAASSWDAFVEAVDREYGGFEGYVTGVLGFSEHDLVVIKKNLAAVV
ncbi:protein-tyrosine phosphatase-like protein [Bombardia bombarda]|uniref:Protein-tyrosine phosphatase-like protein n=1 Tax=Bombardia bombarda TaxID=252184 RepID=A0AA40CEB4_9PEZI|nr:protein-tyrosine phosphatase-like protein [Bombardia bombarda]